MPRKNAKVATLVASPTINTFVLIFTMLPFQFPELATAEPGLDQEADDVACDEIASQLRNGDVKNGWDVGG
jgi:hypothetical protein